MAEILEQCEKEIVAKLKKLEDFKKSLEDALQAIRRVRQHHVDLPALADMPDPSTWLQDIVSQSLNHHLKAPDIIAEFTPSTNVQNQDVDSNSQKVPNLVQSATNTAASEDGPNETSDSNKTDQLIEHLLRVAGAKKGVKYKIEVTSPLSPDGTFWACHVESGFIHSKLEPLSERLKHAIQRDRSLWRVDELTKLVCAKSSSNGLWMRATVVKKMNDNMVKVRFIDIGRTEDCPKSQLSKVPDVLAKIPFMAFNCALIKGATNLGYDAKWRFSDLTKKKILNFTVEDIEERNGLNFLFGKLETILDEPMINVTEEIKKFDQGPPNKAAKSENIVSRDIRTNNGSISGNFTSVSEVISNSEPKNLKPDPSESSMTTLPTAIKKKEAQNLPPLCIASTPPTSTINWGESKTPGADDELELKPLDEMMFEIGADAESNLALSAEQSLTNADQFSIQFTSAENTNFGQGPLTNTLLSEEDVLKSSHLLQMGHDMQTSHNSGHQALLFHNSQTRSSPVRPIGSPSAQMPIGTRPKSSVSVPHASYFSEDIQRVNDYTTKIKQLEAITRSLTMPSDCLDDQHMKELQITKLYLEQQLREEEIRKNQMEQMLRQSTIVGGSAQPACNQADVELQQFQKMTGQSYSDLRLDEMERLIEHQSRLNRSPHTNTSMLSNEHNDVAYNLNNEPKHLSEAVNRNVERTQRNNDILSATDKTLEAHSFEIAPFNSLFTESKKEWAAREFTNLTHPYLEHPNTRFYSVLCVENRPGNFTPKLNHSYTNGFFCFTDSDALVFQKEWDRCPGHVFLIIKHKPFKQNESWKVGGIVQVLSKIHQVPANVRVNYNYQCQIKFVSCATVTDDQSLRSDRSTRGITKDAAKRFIKSLLDALQDGRAVNVFHFLKQPWSNEVTRTEEYLPGVSETHPSYEQSSRFACQPISNHPVMHIDDTENWDLDLQEANPTRSSVDYGSGDESERDLNAEIEAFGLSKEDLV